jgi:hypothetical protein
MFVPHYNIKDPDAVARDTGFAAEYFRGSRDPRMSGRFHSSSIGNLPEHSVSKSRMVE